MRRYQKVDNKKHTIRVRVTSACLAHTAVIVIGTAPQNCQQNVVPVKIQPASSPSSGSNSSLPSSPTEEHSFNVKSDDLTFFLAPTALIQNEMPSEVFGREQENIDKLFTEYIKYEDV
ncbi:6687_t:CDS:2 [Rhizophagus irregularis]|nr:6687_t:CDS:2 [Rhizophagus irregularis]